VHSIFGKINYGGLKHKSLYFGLVGDTASLNCYFTNALAYHGSVLIMAVKKCYDVGQGNESF
jgi:hypothetical protein